MEATAAASSARSAGGGRAAPLLAAVVLLAPTAAAPGPPFVTDDPVPTDRGHWEVYNFASGVRADGATGGQAGFDINYGGAKDLQLTAVVPLGYDSGAGRVGRSNLELAAKYRFLHQEAGALTPDVAVFPRVFVPTAATRLGAGHAQLLLPVWLGKDWGRWSVFGGGGYTLNPGAGQRDFWLVGLGATRSVTARLALGAEVYHRTRDATQGATYTAINLGALYRLGEHWSLIGAAGPGVENSRREGQSSFYVALKADY